MFTTAAKAWLAGLFALIGLLVVATGLFDRQVTASPLVVAQMERMRALEAERACAGIISSEALEECLGTTHQESVTEDGAAGFTTGSIGRREAGDGTDSEIIPGAIGTHDTAANPGPRG